MGLMAIYGSATEGDVMKELIKNYTPQEGNGVIYKYTLDDGRIYIGQTIQPLLKRHGSHCNNAMYIDRALKKHDYFLEVIVEAPIDQLNDLEQYYISKFDCLYPNGLNFSTGGGVGRKLSAESRKKIRDKVSGANHYFYGKHRSKDTREKISQSLKGENHPMYNKRGAETYHHKPIAQLDPITLEVLAEFSCAREAERETGISHAHIGDVCKGRRKHTGGYKWVFI